jgi:hypothetical protein
MLLVWKFSAYWTTFWGMGYYAVWMLMWLLFVGVAWVARWEAVDSVSLA